jgi:hypothetical protein
VDGVLSFIRIVLERIMAAYLGKTVFKNPKVSSPYSQQPTIPYPEEAKFSSYSYILFFMVRFNIILPYAFF